MFRGIDALMGYYGEDAVIKGLLICRVSKEHSLGKNIRAINGVHLDFQSLS